MDLEERLIQVRDLCYGIVTQAIYDIKNEKIPEDVQQDAKEFFFSDWGADIIKAGGFDMPGAELYWTIKYYVDKRKMAKLKQALEKEKKER